MRQGTLAFTSIVAETEWAWLAGFLDGEGCFCITRKVTANPHHTRANSAKAWIAYQAHLQLANTCHAAMERAQPFFGVPVRQRRQTYSNLRPIFALEVGSRLRLRSILPHLIPHLTVKRDHAILMLQFVSTERHDVAARETLFAQWQVLIEQCGQKRIGQRLHKNYDFITKLGELQEACGHSPGNLQPSRRMKYADGRLGGQDIPRTEMKSTSAQAERHDMTRSSEKSEREE